MRYFVILLLLFSFTASAQRATPVKWKRFDATSRTQSLSEKITFAPSAGSAQTLDTSDFIVPDMVSGDTNVSLIYQVLTDKGDTSDTKDSINVKFTWYYYGPNFGVIRVDTVSYYAMGTLGGGSDSAYFVRPLWWKMGAIEAVKIRLIVTVKALGNGNAQAGYRTYYARLYLSKRRER